MALTTEQQAQKDAAVSAAKLSYATRCRELAERFRAGFVDAQDLYKEYIDNEYNDGGANAIADGDLANLRFTEADLAAFVTLMQQAVNLATGQAITPADYWATVNKIK